MGNIELNKMQIHLIEQIYIHPNASTEHHYNDIAIIKLKDKLEFNSRIRPICLPFLDFGDLNDQNHQNDKEIRNQNDEDNSNKFNLNDQNLQMYGFENPNYQASQDSSLSLNFNKPKLRRSSIKQYPLRYANGLANFNYQFRTKRSGNEIKFNDEQNEFYNELFTKSNTKVILFSLL